VEGFARLRGSELSPEALVEGSLVEGSIYIQNKQHLIAQLSGNAGAGELPSWRAILIPSRAKRIAVAHSYEIKANRHEEMNDVSRTHEVE
jgi:hypothetical protein